MSAHWVAEIRVMLKPSVNDPQGLSILGGLHSLGFSSVEGVRAGKLLSVELTAADRAEAHTALTRMCDQLLANPVIEAYEFALEERTPAT